MVSSELVVVGECLVSNGIILVNDDILKGNNVIYI